MGDFSQLVNKALGRNQETGGIAFWEHPERSGWLMKQGTASGDVHVVMQHHACEGLVGAWPRGTGVPCGLSCPLCRGAD